MSEYTNKRLNEILDLEAEIENRQYAPKDHVSAPVEEKFGLATYEGKDLVVAELDEKQDIDDMALSRASIRQVLEITNKNIEGVFEMAKASESPKAFSVATDLIRAVVDAATKLDDLVHKKEKQTKSSTEVVTNNQQVNNYYGSTEDAMKAIREAKKSQLVIDPETE